MLTALAQADEVPTLTSIVSESIPHLKRGVIRDFKKILQTHRYWKDDRWNSTDSIYTFETGSQIEFFSSDNGDKLRGARRDRLFINEANNVPFEAFEQLEVRTKQFVFIDYNPTNEFWAFTDVMGKRNDVEQIILTYKDNEALSQQIIDSIEQRKNRKSWWKVYGEGQLGDVEGKIYKDWQIVDEIPHEARLERIGIDFGYSNDPTAIIKIYYYNGGYILDEETFLKGLSNKQIADILLGLETKALVVADSAEPKSIDEIRGYGINITGADKGKDSVAHGIQLVQDQKISVTKRSVNLIKEYRNYLWEIDKNGKILNVPEHTFSHCFSGDSLVHTTKGRIKIKDLVGKTGYLFTRDGKIERFFDVKQTRQNAEMVHLTFDDGEILKVTPDHLLLLPSGMWIEAALLRPDDLIQSVMYGNKNYLKNTARILWESIYKIQGHLLLQGLFVGKKMVSASGSLGGLEWKDTQGKTHPSQRSQFKQQRTREFRIDGCGTAFERAHDAREATKAKRMDQKDCSSYQEMAFVRRGQGVAQVAWEESISNKKTSRERLCSLPYAIFNFTIRQVNKILPSELQNESQTKTVKRITRGFSKVTYNLEVENTHCLLVNGVLTHNSMDAIRYGLVSLLKAKPKTDDKAEEVAINKFLRHTPGIRQVEIGTPKKDFDEKRAVQEFLYSKTE